MSSVTTEYAGRTIDVLAFAGAVPGHDTLVSQVLALPGQGGQICTGVVKLAQRFLLELLTPVSSLLYLPTRGTDFLPQALQGALRTPAAVMVALSAALVDVQKNLQAEETGLEPLDERYASASVLSVAVASGQVSVSIQVNSLAGSSRTIILPLSTILGGGP